MRQLMRTLVFLVLAGLLYLLAWPIPMAPVAWQAPQGRGLVGSFRSNGKLAQFELLAPDHPGPEALVSDGRGNLYSGTRDGRIIVLDAAGRVRDFARTGGRPLGLCRRADGSLLAAVVRRGIVEIDGTGRVRTLVAREGERPITFPDALDVLPDGRIVFTEATTRFSLEEFKLDALEHGTTGALFAFQPATHTLTALARGLSFANGVAAHPSGRYVLVNETWNYRVLRVWLDGPRAGRREVVIDNLPGFPDNITFDAERGLFWVALGSVRHPLLDKLAPHPFVRTMVARLPGVLRPAPAHHGMVLAIDERGRVVHFFDDPRAESYAPITNVLPSGDSLYLGSHEHPGIARVKLASLGLR